MCCGENVDPHLLIKGWSNFFFKIHTSLIIFSHLKSSQTTVDYDLEEDCNPQNLYYSKCTSPQSPTTFCICTYIGQKHWSKAPQAILKLQHHFKTKELKMTHIMKANADAYNANFKIKWSLTLQENIIRTAHPQRKMNKIIYHIQLFKWNKNISF